MSFQSKMQSDLHKSKKLKYILYNRDSRLFLLGTILCVGFLTQNCSDTGDPDIPPDIFQEKLYSVDGSGRLIDSEMTTTDFFPADSCQSCHPDQYNEWAGSMHAYAMKDPVFFSGWTGEQLSRPNTGERFCLQCHNPVAFVTGVYLDEYDDSEALQNSSQPAVIKEGIGCDVCHTMTRLTTGVVTGDDVAANAEYHLNPGERKEYGSIDEPLYNPFHESVYAPIFQRSEICLPCHDFFIRGVEAEITYTEWNRIPAAAMSGGMTCQNCHMVKRENGHSDHRFTGVDLDLSEPVEGTEQYLAVSQLLENSVDIIPGFPGETFPASVSIGGSMSIPLTISSLTGHAIPSGVTFVREVWLELTVSQNDNIIFSSGLLDNNQDPLDMDDEQLLVFYSQLLDDQGYHISGVTNAFGIINNTLPGFGDRYKTYSINLAPELTGEINISARMLFRPFKPEILQGAHQDLLENLPVFEMASYQGIVSIQ